MATKESVGIVIPRLEQVRTVVPVRGISPLIVHRFAEKAKKEMRDKQQKKAKKPKAAKNPQADFEGARYLLDDKRHGFPAICFKKACIAATRYVDGLTMTYVRGAFFVEGEYSTCAGLALIPLKYDEVIMREDAVRIGHGTADLRYRPEYRKWSCELTVRIMPNILSAEQFLNLLDIAGQCVGVGEWRPERGGDFGRFCAEERDV